jgi:hypothetical protein
MGNALGASPDKSLCTTALIPACYLSALDSGLGKRNRSSRPFHTFAHLLRSFDLRLEEVSR